MKTRVLGYRAKLDFGKYRGRTIRDVLIENPSYIVWASENVWWFKVKDYILEEAIELAFEREVRRQIKYTTFYLSDYDYQGNYDPY